jgi:hypothetical protein
MIPDGIAQYPKTAAPTGGGFFMNGVDPSCQFSRRLLVGFVPEKHSVHQAPSLETRRMFLVVTHLPYHAVAPPAANGALNKK